MAFNKELDKALIDPIRVKGESEGFKFEVKSYNGGEPRIAITRFYRATKAGKSVKVGEWVRDEEKQYPRMSFRLFRWLREHGGRLDSAFEDWQRSRQGKDKGTPRKSDPDDFP